MSNYREKLLPGPTVFFFSALVIPAALLVFLPINLMVGVIVAGLLYGTVVILLIVGSPRVEVTDTSFIAGRASLPLVNVGATKGFLGAEATQERGPRLDARAWLVIRGWIKPVVKITLDDPHDPTPYWLVSTRHPSALIAALVSAREKASA
jgi:hypothetical protein